MIWYQKWQHQSWNMIYHISLLASRIPTLATLLFYNSSWSRIHPGHPVQHAGKPRNYRSHTDWFTHWLANSLKQGTILKMPAKILTYNTLVIKMRANLKSLRSESFEWKVSPSVHFLHTRGEQDVLEKFWFLHVFTSMYYISGEHARKIKNKT